MRDCKMRRNATKKSSQRCRQCFRWLPTSHDPSIIDSRDPLKALKHNFIQVWYIFFKSARYWWVVECKHDCSPGWAPPFYQLVPSSSSFRWPSSLIPSLHCVSFIREPLWGVAPVWLGVLRVSRVAPPTSLLPATTGLLRLNIEGDAWALTNPEREREGEWKGCQGLWIWKIGISKVCCNRKEEWWCWC